MVHLIVPLLILIAVVTHYMPVSCRVVGSRIVMRTPSRTIEAVLLEKPRREKGCLIPLRKARPSGESGARLCAGWRLPTTLLSDCGDEFFFSMPDCDGNWLVAEAEMRRSGSGYVVAGVGMVRRRLVFTSLLRHTSSLFSIPAVMKKLLSRRMSKCGQREAVCGCAINFGHMLWLR